MNIEDALAHAAEGESILFLGAGFSLGATNLKDAPFKTGRALAAHLAAAVDLAEDTALQDASDVYLDKYGTDELVRLLRREFTAKHVTDEQRTVARVRWKRVYTTNYDNVFEFAAAQENRAVSPVDSDTSIASTAKGDLLTVHLNGFINTLNRENIGSTFRLTDTSYATAAIESSEWAAAFRQDIRFARSIFFVGYSLADLDIKRLLREHHELIPKTLFIQHSSVDAVTELKTAKYGSVLKVGVSGLAEAIRAGEYWKSRTSGKPNIGRSVREYVSPPHPRPISDRDFLDLIMLGEFKAECSLHDPSAESTYVCDRALCTTILDQLDRRESRAVVIHGNIANGKSVLLQILARDAVIRGWQVFLTSELSSYAAREFAEVAALPGKTLLLVDDYVDWIDALAKVAMMASDRFALVLTARTNSHDLSIDELENSLSPLQITEVDGNTLRNEEIDWWIRTLDLYGLWGDLASRSHDAKMRYLVDHCDRQTHGILLKLFESPAISKRLLAAATLISRDSATERLAIAIFVMTILNQRPSVDALAEILGSDIVDKPSVRANEGLRTFADLNRYAIRVRSTMAAEFLLNNFWRADTIVDTLLIMARAADRLYDVSLAYEQLFKTLMRFSSVQQILPPKGKREAVIRYYEELKLIGKCQRFPLFWLQYAIAAVVNGYLDRASRYFETAYSLAIARGWDTFQIDNHYARYLLVRATEDAPFDEVMVLFREARSLINRQIRTDRLHYPYRVASAYQTLFDKFQSRFDSDELREIEQAAKTVFDRIGELSAYESSNKYVKRCRESMKYIMHAVEAKLGAL